MRHRVSITRRLAVPAAAGAALALVLVLVGLQPGWDRPLVRTALVSAVTVCAGAIVIRLIGHVLFDILFVRSRGREAPDILRFVVAVVGYSALFAFIYTVVLDRDLSGVFATSAVVSVILGLALQDTLGNFFAGLSLHTEEPYHIGDTIRLGDVVGRVESVTWRTTALRTNDNSLIVFPNSKIAREPIEIYALRAENRRALRFPAPYGVPPESIVEAIGDIVRSFPDFSPGKVPVVRVAGFGESSMDYEILYWVPDYMRVADTEPDRQTRRQSVLRRIQRFFGIG